MIEDKGHIESRPYCEPFQPTSHDHEHDEGQCVPGIDRRADQEGATVEPASQQHVSNTGSREERRTATTAQESASSSATGMRQFSGNQLSRANRRPPW
jgi:hypothetical protein